MLTYLWNSDENVFCSSPLVVVTCVPLLFTRLEVMFVDVGLKLMAQMMGLSVSSSGVRSGARTM